MWRPARQRKAVVAVGLAIAALSAFGAKASETKLLAACAEPAHTGPGAPFPGAAGGQRTLTCELRATGAAEFQDVKARIKGEDSDLETRFEAFDPVRQGSTTAYLIQTLPAARRATLGQMADAVVSIAERRDGRRRFAAYTFADGLTAVADSGVSRDEFVRQLVAIGPAAGSTHLYKAAHAAVESLASETGTRKSLVILGDGTSDDTDVTHDQVVKAARDAGVAIHVLGYYDDARQRTKFEALSRLAEETGGYAAQVKRGAGAKNDFTRDIVTASFLTDVIENGGTATAVLTGSAGERTVAFTAGLANGKSLAAETQVSVPAAPPPLRVEAPEPTAVPERDPESEHSEGVPAWLLLLALGAVAGLGVAGYRLYGRQLIEAFWTRGAADAARDVDTDAETEVATGNRPVTAPAGEPRTERLAGASGGRARDGERGSVVYGWLEMLDGEAARHPLRATDVRVGRHRDNDICLLNDSISRRHALVHYDTEKRRFTITDLGAGNGVIVNKTRYKSRELNDGDTVELGEVRLRFRAEPEFLS